MAAPAVPSALSESRPLPAPLSAYRWGIGRQIYLGLFGSVALVIAASLVAHYYLGKIVQYQSRLTVQSIPNLSRAVDVARRSAALVNGAERMAAAASLEDHAGVSEDVFRERDGLVVVVKELAEGASLADQARMLEGRLTKLGALLEQVRQSSRRRLVIEQSLGHLVDELGEINRRIGRITNAAIDDQAFFLVEGLRGLQAPRQPLAQRASAAELAHYRDLIEVNNQANLGGFLLSETLSISNRDLLEPSQERFQSAGQRLLRALDRLEANAYGEAGVLSNDGERLVEIGESAEGVFALRRESLERLAEERTAIAAGREVSAKLLLDMEILVAEVRNEALSVNGDSQAAASAGILLLSVLNLLSIIGALLIGWLFVGRHLVRRLVNLAAAMRDMANGDLEAPVAVTGNDEVTDMANALEVFRRYALEVQRLNLVEKLAEELDAKNKALGHTLERLEEAQQQIIAEEKLSSLGQLTAGVAHEIKNPLNFVNNFAEVSVELVDEIGEIVEESKEDGEDVDLAGEIEDILDDLRVNLRKVGEHGARANGIVQSMLEHSRATPGDWRETDLNALLKQYLDLAYHAIRAQDRDFNATLEQDLDESLGLVEVVPQDLSRAFTNILTNAFQAMEEKWRKLGADYDPKIRISSRRLADDALFSIWDNGPGIPEDLRERVFEPFVTTKDAGKGTGLGLSLTVDIITRHGGSIEVDSQEGAYTEMRIRLPLDSTAPRASVANAE